jgi:hypothetical protein
MKVRAFLFASLFLIACGASAQGLEGQGALGVGSDPDGCANWTMARGLPTTNKDGQTIQAVTLHWVAGFLSGANVYRTLNDPSKKPLTLSQKATVMAYLDNACRQDPVAQIWEHSTRLFIELQKRGQ